MFSEIQLNNLRECVGQRLSDKRFRHTLGVERMAKFLAEKIMPERTSEIRAAALLHDITKELSDREQIDILNNLSDITDSDLISAPIFHSLSAPTVILCDYPQFATRDILSAVKKHTTGDPEMSIFDEIIFISDYTEEGRTYPACVAVREDLLLGLNSSEIGDDAIPCLHDAVIKALNNTIISLTNRGEFLHEKTVMTRNAFLGRRPMPLK